MDKLILLVGASGSGKTTIARELEKEGYNIIHSYTTRKPREENEWGHIFIKKAIGHKVKKTNNMIAFKQLYDYEYWATKEQYEGKGTSIYIVCPKGAEQVKENAKDVEVITVFLMADYFEREKRLFKRKKCKSQIDAIYDRLDDDDKIFKTCKCDYVVDANREVKEVSSDVVEIIGGLDK